MKFPIIINNNSIISLFNIDTLTDISNFLLSISIDMSPKKLSQTLVSLIQVTGIFSQNPEKYNYVAGKEMISSNIYEKIYNNDEEINELFKTVGVCIEYEYRASAKIVFYSFIRYLNLISEFPDDITEPGLYIGFWDKMPIEDINAYWNSFFNNKKEA